jgi:hypothetical protein
MAKKIPPCIRGLKRFEKTGCPGKSWDGNEGCPAWREMIIPNQGQPTKREHKAQCLDQWYFDFQWAALGLLEGNQQATETFRNQMTTPQGPRPDPASIALVECIDRFVSGSKPKQVSG